MPTMKISRSVDFVIDGLATKPNLKSPDEQCARKRDLDSAGPALRINVFGELKLSVPMDRQPTDAKPNRLVTQRDFLPEPPPVVDQHRTKWGVKLDFSVQKPFAEALRMPTKSAAFCVLVPPIDHHRGLKWIRFHASPTQIL